MLSLAFVGLGSARLRMYKRKLYTDVTIGLKSNEVTNQDVGLY